MVTLYQPTEQPKKSKLISFNKKFGYAPRLGYNSNSERFLCSIPLIPIFANCGSVIALMKQQPHMTPRVIMCSVFVGIPVVIVLDLVGTIVTHPMQSSRERKASKEIQAINPSVPSVRPITEQKRKIRKTAPDESSTAESLAGLSGKTSSSLESSS